MEQGKVYTDSLLELLGKFNFSTIFWYFVINMLKSSCAVFSIMAFMWPNAKPTKYHCKIPPGYNLNESVPENEACLQYKNFSILTNETETCELGYEYEGYMDTTVITEWNLVCDSRNVALAIMANSSIFILAIFGSSLFTATADRFGRRLIFLIAHWGVLIIGILLPLSPNVYMYICLRLILGPLQQGTYVIGYCYMLELFPIKLRSMVGLLSEVFWVFWSCILCLIVYYVRDWKMYYYVTNAPFFVSIILYWFMPESIPWLFSKGRSDEAYRTLEKMTVFMKNRDEVIEKLKIAKANLHLNKEEKEVFVAAEEEQNNIYPFYFVFTKHPLRLWSLINGIAWFSIGLSYYGFNIMATIYGSVYFNAFLLAIIELPGLLTATIATKIFTRRFLVINSFFLMSILLALHFVGLEFAKNLIGMNIVLLTIGKFFSMVIFATIFLHASEMYPTSLRGMGVAVATSAARLGMALSPVLAITNSYVTTVVIVIVSIIGGCLYIVLPETRRWPLPQSLEEVNLFRSDPKYQNSYFQFKTLQELDDANNDMEMQDKIYKEEQTQEINENI